MRDDIVILSMATIDEQALSRFKKNLLNLNLKFNINYLVTPTVDYCKQFLDYALDDEKYIEEYVGFQKPKLIKHNLLKHKSPIMYIDIDMFLLEVPDFSLLLSYDIGFLNKNKVLFFNYTPDSIKFLTSWEYLCGWPNFAKTGADQLLMLMKSFSENESRCNTTKHKCLIYQKS